MIKIFNFELFIVSTLYLQEHGAGYLGQLVDANDLAVAAYDVTNERFLQAAPPELGDERHEHRSLVPRTVPEKKKFKKVKVNPSLQNNLQ